MTVQALYTAATGMTAMQTRLDVVANNLANVETTAFKRDRANFEDLFYRQEKMPGSQDSTGLLAPLGIAIGTGVRVESTQTDQTQGSLQQTGRDLDVAIQGRGFFRVLDPSGETLYTRAGTFNKNSVGQLVVASANVGRLLDPPITIPQDATAVNISPEGIVTVQLPNQQQMQQVGTIELATFINPQGLLKRGENLYGQSEASGNPITGNPGTTGFGTLQQSALESSNVEPVAELIDLIKTQRAFELNSQVVQAGDQVMQMIANLRRA